MIFQSLSLLICLSVLPRKKSSQPRAVNEMKPKLRPSVFISHQDDEYRFFFTNTRATKRYKLNTLAQKLLRLLDGKHATDEIVERLRHEPGFKNEQDVTKTLSFLARENIIEDAARMPPGGCFSPVELERYERQLNFWGDFASNEVDKYQYQKRLKDKSVALIGLGGAGTWAAYGLLMAGVGRLLVIDYDRIELSNLNRQAIYAEADIGQEKIKVFREKAKAINSHVEVETLSIQLKEDTDLGSFVKGYDLVMSLADVPTAETVSGWIGRACVPLSIPHIIGGGYSLHVGLIGSTVIPYQTGCWQCWLNYLNKDESYQRDKEWASTVKFLRDVESISTGSLGVTSAIIGNFHALEALKILTAFAPPMMCNARAELDFLTFNTRWDRFSRDLECSLCGK